MDTPLNVLLVEDNAHVAAVIEALIQNNDAGNTLTISCVETLKAAVKEIVADHIDAVLLDLGLPDADELEALKALRLRWPYLVIIVVTGAFNLTESQVMRAGACDYFVKGAFSGRDLVYSIHKCYIRRMTMQKFAPAHASQQSTGRAIDAAKESTSRAIEAAKGEIRHLEDSGEFSVPKGPM